MIHNDDIANLFDKVAELLELEGANPYRIRAYRTAGQLVRDLEKPVALMVVQHEDLTRLPGIGKDLAGKIEEVVRTGSLSVLVKLEERTPTVLVELLQIPGLGPKRAERLYQELGITTLSGLRAAAREGQIRELPGFGRKMEENILEGIKKRTAYLPAKGR